MTLCALIFCLLRFKAIQCFVAGSGHLNNSGEVSKVGRKEFTKFLNDIQRFLSNIYCFLEKISSTHITQKTTYLRSIEAK